MNSFSGFSASSCADSSQITFLVRSRSVHFVFTFLAGILDAIDLEFGFSRVDFPPKGSKSQSFFVILAKALFYKLVPNSWVRPTSHHSSQTCPNGNGLCNGLIVVIEYRISIPQAALLREKFKIAKRF